MIEQCKEKYGYDYVSDDDAQAMIAECIVCNNVDVIMRKRCGRTIFSSMICRDCEREMSKAEMIEFQDKYMQRLAKAWKEIPDDVFAETIVKAFYCPVE